MKLKRTENSGSTKLVEIFNRIIREEKFPIGICESNISVGGADTGKFADILIRSKDGTPLFNIENKPPGIGWTPFDSPLVLDAALKSFLCGNDYFGTCNFAHFIMYTRTASNTPSYESIVWQHVIIDDSRVTIDDMDKPEIVAKFENFARLLFKKILQLRAANTPEEIEEAISKKPLDEYFINKLRDFIDSVYVPIALEIKEQFTTNPDFKTGLIKWSKAQMWDITFKDDDDFEKIARQYAYLFVNKILFYQCLRGKYPDIEAIKIPEKLESAEKFRKELNKFLDKASEKNYEIIFKANYIEMLPLPKSIIPGFARFTNQMEDYESTGIGYDILGSVFERLIPENERKKLGQYYTNSLLVDIINALTIKNPHALILDTSVGAGTFPVRAYQLLKRMEPSLTHAELLTMLYGIDISKFAVHLSTINLAILDLNVLDVHPNIIYNDFFNTFPAKSGFVNHHKIKTITGTELTTTIPMFDVLVGNPPYTRHEGMLKEIKKHQAKVVKDETGMNLGGRAGIYVYFFMHSKVFLKEGGRNGFVTSNAWLSSDYGKYLQEFFLKSYKIVAIIDSKVERWFPDAAVNTAITVVELCSDKKERDENIVKFVCLNKPITELIRYTDESKRYIDIDTLINKIETTNELYIDENLRVCPVSQKDLWAWGCDADTGKYTGDSWSKYIRAPDIYYTIMKKGRGKMVPIKSIADVTCGTRSGASKFFCVDRTTIDFWGIEEEYVKDIIIKSPKEISGVTVDLNELSCRALTVNKSKVELEGTKVLKYILEGEKKRYNLRDGLYGKDKWYSIETREYADILFRKNVHETFNYILLENDMPIDQSFFRLCMYNRKYTKAVASLLNSTLGSLTTELNAHNSLGEGCLVAPEGAIKAMPIISPDTLTSGQIKKLEENFDKLAKRKIGTIFEEVGVKGNEAVSLELVKPDRRELDKLVLGEILGLTETEQLEVYRVIIDLVKKRKEKAKSVPKIKNKKRNKPEEFTNMFVKKIGKLPTFPDSYLRKGMLFSEKTVIPGEPKKGRDLEGYYIKIDNEVLRSDDKTDADYVYYGVLNGITKIKIPLSETAKQNILKKYETVYRKTELKLTKLINEYITDEKLKIEVTNMVWRRILRDSD